MYRIVLALVIVQLVLPSTALAGERAAAPVRSGLLLAQGPAPVSGYPPVHTPDPPPSTGVAYIVTGSILLGVGVLNLATAPICKVDDIIRDPDVQDGCLAASLIIGGTFVAVGTPLLIVGIGKRSAYKRWQQQHPVASRLLEGLHLATSNKAKGVMWRVRF